MQWWLKNYSWKYVFLADYEDIMVLFVDRNILFIQEITIVRQNVPFPIFLASDVINKFSSRRKMNWTS